MARILVVDDEPNIREVVGLYLRRDGHAVVEAADGEEALELYSRTSPDLVVLDLMLPKMSGLEVCRRLGADRRAPLIMLTACGEEEDRFVGLSFRRRRLRDQTFLPARAGRPRRGCPPPRGGTHGGQHRREAARLRWAGHRPEQTRGDGTGRARNAHRPRVRSPLPPGEEPGQGPHTRSAHGDGLGIRLPRRHQHDYRTRAASAREDRGRFRQPPLLGAVWGVGYRFGGR